MLTPSHSTSTASDPASDTPRECRRHCVCLRGAFITALFLAAAVMPLVHAGSLVLPDAQLASYGQRHHASALAAAERGDGFRLDGVRLSANVKHVRVFFETAKVEDRREGIAFQEAVDLEGFGIGFGVFASLPSNFDSFQMSTRLAFHRAKFDVASPISVSGRQATANIDRTSITATLRINPITALNRYGLSAIAGVGIRLHNDKLSVSVDRQLEPRLAKKESELFFTATLGLTQQIGLAQIFLVAEQDNGLSATLGLQLGGLINQ